ncbi:GNAT family N-acetyltransferase [Luteimonas sp. RIT-PG2_3]
MPTLRILEALPDDIAPAWDALHDGNPFVSHAFLSGLEQHGCLRPDWGWRPQHLALWDGDALVAAAPAYRKQNSHGEFVFDHAWANAYARYGLDYYPKLLCASPYSPVTGPRLLTRDPALQRSLLTAMTQACEGRQLSSAHVNFHTTQDDQAFDDARFEGGWLARSDVQYHWRNPGDWRDFDDYLAAMDHKHRKNIRQERRKVFDAGVTFRVVHGDEASEDDLDAMHGFYLQTFAEYGNHPALTRAFLQHLATTMPRQLVMIFADWHGEAAAGALCLRGPDTLYGRYWGSRLDLPGLHFETCYYQGIAYCLREGLSTFEPGAQGEHKLARGFLPTLVRSRHWIADPGFREPLRQWCLEEQVSVERYAAMLAQRSPFRDLPALTAT